MANKTFEELEKIDKNENPSLAERFSNALCRKGIHGKKERYEEYGTKKKRCRNCHRSWYR